MSKSIISEGKTTNEAIEKGLKQLNVSKNDVEIRVLENDEKRSFFDILAPRIVKVELIVKENNTEKHEVTKSEIKREKEIKESDLLLAQTRVEKFLQEFFDKLPESKFEYSIKIQDNEILADINGDDAGILIGYRGDAMNALQNILSSVANNEMHTRIRVILDIEGYRAKRIRVLEDLATKVSKTVIKTGKSITLEPMTAFERKIIHSKLQENAKITTYSVGEEPHRKVVVAKK